MKRRCVFKGRVIAGARHECAGRPTWHHVVPKQRIKDKFPLGAFRIRFKGGEWQPWEPQDRRGIPLDLSAVVAYEIECRSLAKIIEDERNRVWVCWPAHAQVEAKRPAWRLPKVPESVREFAAEFGMEWSLESDERKAVA